LLTEFRCAAVVVHHGNKPPSGQQKPQWQAGDYAYLGGGSAEWANWARAVLVIRSIGSEEIFELRAAKRGRRLLWTDKDGNFTSHKFIAWSKDRKLICWREPAPEEITEFETAAGKPGRPRKLEVIDLLHCIEANPGKNQTFLIGLIQSRLNGCGRTTIKDAFHAAEHGNFIRFQKNGFRKAYAITDKGRKLIDQRPTQFDWKSESENPV
jgi:predicted transcriptional regulator